MFGVTGGDEDRALGGAQTPEVDSDRPGIELRFDADAVGIDVSSEDVTHGAISDVHTSEFHSHRYISYASFC